MADYYSIITNRGKELEVEALASGRPIVLTHFVVGDSNGKHIKPDPEQIRLVNETFRGDIAALVVSPEQASQLMAKIVLPTNVGGFTVREVGLLTDSGELYAVANCPSIDKPAGGVSVNMQFRLAISDTSNITLNVATGDGLFLRIDQNLKEIKARGDDAQRESRESIGVRDASTQQKGLVQLNSAVTSTSETQGATPAAVRIAMENANARLAKERNGADIPNKPLFIQNVGLQKTVDLAASAVQSTSVSASSFADAFTADANNLPENAVSFVYASAKNSPGFEASLLDYSGLRGRYNTQFAASYAQPGKLRFRTKNGDIDQWNPWMDIITTTGGTISGSLRVDSGIGLGTDNVLGGNSIALGDSDTGFKQNGDGVLDVIANNVQVMRFTSNAAQVNNWSGSWINMREQICYSGQNMVLNDSASAIVRQEHQDRHFYIGGLGNYQFGVYMTNKSRTENGTDGQAYMDSNGNWVCGKNIQAGDSLITGGGASTFASNGDILGAAWGGGWLSTRVNSMAARDWVLQWFVQDVSRGAQGSMTMDGALVEAPSGCFLTGGNGNEGNQVGVALYRPLQIWRGNGWATISG